MTPIRFSPSSLKEGRWYEYLIRFALGGGQQPIRSAHLCSNYPAACLRSRKNPKVAAPRVHNLL
jgi:hypothetical protein